MYSLILIAVLYLTELHAKDFPLPTFGGQMIPHDNRTTFTDIATFEPVVDVHSKRTHAIIEKFREHHLDHPLESFTFANGVTIARDLIDDAQWIRYQEQNNASYNSALHEPSEEPHFVEIIKSGCIEGNVFLDVGAASGYYCALAKTLCPSLTTIAINPSSHFRHAIMDTMYRNNVDEYISIPYAIGEMDGDVVAIGNTYGAYLMDEKKKRLNGRSTAYTITMDSLLNSVEVYLGREPKITLMMVDIQGWEKFVLPLVNETHFPFIRNWMVGTHGKKVHKNLVTTFESPPYSNHYKVIRKQFTIPMQPDGLIQMKLLSLLDPEP